MAVGPTPTINTSVLASTLTNLWYKAKTHKDSIQLQLLDSLKAYNSQYSALQLAEIEKLTGSTVFLALTATKSNTMIAMLTDIAFGSGEEPWDIEHTPIPDLPPDKAEQITERVMRESLETVMEYAMIKQVPPEEIMESMSIPLQERIDAAFDEYAKIGTDQIREKMEDQLVEGGWYRAMQEVLFDLVVYKAAFLKGVLAQGRQFRLACHLPE